LVSSGLTMLSSSFPELTTGELPLEGDSARRELGRTTGDTISVFVGDRSATSGANWGGGGSLTASSGPFGITIFFAVGPTGTAAGGGIETVADFGFGSSARVFAESATGWTFRFARASRHA
jgi:hypothetical protein